MNTTTDADLLDIALGLRAMVKGQAPTKPTLRVVGPVQRLKRSTKADTLQREMANWTERLRHTRGAQAERWAEQLAAAELSSWRSWELEQLALGHKGQTHRDLDRVVGQDEAGNDLTHHEVVGDPRWKQELAAAELREVLVLHLTTKEVEALEQCAAGVAVTDRHCLARARRKAQAALST